MLLLGGLAILAVVLHHAAGYGQVALFLWADRYLPVSVPYWEAFGSLPHYVLLVVKSVGAFAVPAFLFIAGFYSTYVSRGSSSTDRQWKAVFRRIWALAIPYVIWSTVIFVGDALQGATYGPLDYVAKLLNDGASGYLSFVPLLCGCYLLSPRIVALARGRPRLLLAVTGSVQIVALLAAYLRRYGITNLPFQWVRRATLGVSLPWWMTYFVVGTVTSLNLKRAQELLIHYRWPIVAVAFVAWLLNVVETDYLLRTFQTDWMAGIDTLSYNLFAVSAIACFLAFPDVRVPWSKAVQELGKRSYGVYLMHVIVIEFIARVIRHSMPSTLRYLAILVPLLLIAGLAVPLLAMEAVKQWAPGRRVYRYVFG